MNLNVNCYDLTDQLNQDESVRGTSFIIQIPFKAYKLLKVIDNNLYVVVDIDSLDQSYVQLSFIPAGWDIKYIDNILNNNPNLYDFLGEYKLHNESEFVFLFGRCLTDNEIRRLKDD